MAIPTRGPYLGALAILGVGAAILFFSKKAQAKDAGPTWEPLLAELEKQELAHDGQIIESQRIRELIIAGEFTEAQKRMYNLIVKWGWGTGGFSDKTIEMFYNALTFPMQQPPATGT